MELSCEEINHAYGYIRVSSTDQNEDRQVIALHELGILDSHICIDKQSGKNFDSSQYQALVDMLASNDLLCVKSIDRLGRNYEEIRRDSYRHRPSIIGITTGNRSDVNESNR